MSDQPPRPLSGAWSTPDTLTGQATPPPRPTGVYLVRTIPDRRARYIDCNVAYCGADASGTHWWRPRPVIDTWIDPATDRIESDPLPLDTRIHGMEPA